MPLLTSRPPKYRKHKASGQAVVTLGGHDYYLGPHGTRSSKQEYDRLISEWLAGGRKFAKPNDRQITVVEINARYLNHAEAYYRGQSGRPSKESLGIAEARRPLKRLCGRTPAIEFGPLRLKAVQREMIQALLCLSTINCRVGRIKRMFRWAASNELVPVDVFRALQTVEGLRRGRSEARDPKGVKPVSDEAVDATLPHVPPVVASMIRLQRLTGMRSGELTIMRGYDLDTTGRVWTYTPATHKTEHHGHERPIHLGPRAQEIIRPFLKADLSAYLFSPVESEAGRRAEAHRRRTTPLSHGNRPGTNRKRRPKRRPRDHYTTDSYRRAIERRCERAFSPPCGLSEVGVKQRRKDHRWHPHQLRHSAATRLRREYGIEAARVVLGHRSAAITEVYAEIDGAKAAEIMARVG